MSDSTGLDKISVVITFSQGLFSDDLDKKGLSFEQVVMKSNFSLPDDMKFGEAQMISITAYSIMFMIGLTQGGIKDLTSWEPR